MTPITLEMQFDTIPEYVLQPPAPTSPDGRIPLVDGGNIQKVKWLNTDLMSTSPAGGELCMKAVSQALRDSIKTRELQKSMVPKFSGGITTKNPPLLHVCMGDTYVDAKGVECRVSSVLERLKLTSGLPILRVKGTNVITGVLTEDYIAPAGEFAVGYSVAREGVLKLSIGHTSECKPRHIMFPFNPTFPYRGSFIYPLWIRRLVWTVKEWVRKLLGYPNLTRVVRIDQVLYKHLFDQRLGTSSSIETASVKRIIHSSAIKFAHSDTSAQSIKTTVELFVEDSASPTYHEDLDRCVVTDLTKFPAITDPEVFVCMVGQGDFVSSESEAQVAVIDNKNLYVIKSEGATLEDGVLRFNTTYRNPDPLYFYGPRVASAAVVYSTRSTLNLEHAAKRLLNSRGRGLTGYEENDYRRAADFLLMEVLQYPNVSRALRGIAATFRAFNDWGLNFNQYHRYRGTLPPREFAVRRTTGAFIRSFVESMALRARDFADEVEEIVTENYFEAMKKYSELDHAKRAERVGTFEDMVRLPWKFDPLLQRTFVEGKTKWETAKYGKLPRMFISLGCPRALFAPQIPEFVKKLMSYTHEVTFNMNDRRNVFKYKFWKSPAFEEMAEWSKSILDMPKECEDVLLNYHSDDSHLSIPVVIGGRRCRINVCVDIAKCDLSHAPSLFVLSAYLCMAVGMDPLRVRDLFVQLQSPIRIPHPNRKVDEFMLLGVHNMILFTGSTLTTLINNTASLLILTNIALTLLMNPIPSQEDAERMIVDAAAQAGYEVTLDAIVYSYDDNPVPDTAYIPLTFLKHFPVRALSGAAIAIKDIATLIRGLGVSDTICECEKRLQEIVEGWKNTPSSDLLDSIFTSVNLPLPNFPERVCTSNYSVRYNVTEFDLLEGFSLLFSQRTACLVGHPALDAVLRSGYGLPRMAPKELHLQPDGTTGEVPVSYEGIG